MSRTPAVSHRRRLTVLGTAAWLAGCANLEAETRPRPHDGDETRQRVAEDKHAMYAAQEPVTGPIDFYEAAARALKYNLDYRIKLLESALSVKLRDVSQHEMLPRLVASAGRLGRTNDSGGTSIGIEDRQESLRPSTSEERYRNIGALGLSWSVLDFGLAYYRTQQKADQILMAEERRRKVAQNVLQDVRNAYWRALAAQRLLPEVDALLDRTRQALRSAREAEDKGLLPRQEILAYQRALIDSVYLLTVRRQDLEFARAELVALMSLPPGTNFRLAEDLPEFALPVPPTNIAHLEQLSLERRPEIMEEWYRKRVNNNDLEIAKLQLWPNVTVNAGAEFNSNKYLYNNQWGEVGIQVSVNLLRLLQYPSLHEAQATQGQTDDTRRIALSMAVLTQVRVGLLRYALARQEVDFADESLRVDRALLDFARAAKSTSFGSSLEVIRAEGRFLLARYQREAAYSSAQAAYGRLYNSIGLDTLPETIAEHDIKTIARGIQRTIAEQEARNMLAVAQGGGDAPGR